MGQLIKTSISWHLLRELTWMFWFVTCLFTFTKFDRTCNGGSYFKKFMLCASRNVEQLRFSIFYLFMGTWVSPMNLHCIILSTINCHFVLKLPAIFWKDSYLPAIFLHYLPLSPNLLVLTLFSLCRLICGRSPLLHHSIAFIFSIVGHKSSKLQTPPLLMFRSSMSTEIWISLLRPIFAA